LVAYASSLDQIGVIGRKVEDCAIVLETIAGRDEKDSTSTEVKVERYFHQLKFGVKGIKLGLPKEYFEECMEKRVSELVLEGVRLLEKEGAEIREISLPYTKYAVAIYYLIATAEASANLARYDGIKYGYRVKEKDIKKMYEKVRGKGFGEEVKRRIMLGAFALKAGYFDEYYLKAVKARNVIIKEFEEAFEKVDVIITPIYPTKVFKLGEKISNPLELYLSDIFTVTINLAGLPAIAIKCGEIGRLPVGLQVVGSRFAENKVLRVAYTYEKL
jgi:aspartyl-tRNA(Asn)/glutamyl-tRNA(Gln) amidotransferase subunit A